MLRQLVLLLSVVALVSCLGDKRSYGTKNVHSKKTPFTVQSPLEFAAPEPEPAAPSTYAQHGFPAMEMPPAVPPSPYSFGYEADGSARQESRDDSGKVTGSYTVVNEDGSMRVVKYIADEQGFRAVIDTDEPGTKSDNPANIELKSSAKAPVLDAAPAKPQSILSYSAPQHKKYTPPIAQHASVASKPAEEPIPPYAFSFSSQLDDGSNARSESSDGTGKVVGSYSLSSADGGQRQVDYSADHSGFHASINTNEFGTKSESPADVKFVSNAPSSVTEQKQTSVHYSSGSSGFNQKKTFVSQTQHVLEEYAPPSPYEFSYNADLEDGSSYRSESSDGSGKISGSYKLSVADGRHRTVDYLADAGGFRATVNTNEFGTRADSPADVMFYSTATEEEPAPYKSPSYVRQEQHTQKKVAYNQAQQKPFPLRGAVKQEQQQEPSPYSFNYENQMESGMSSHSETADSTGKVMGSYSLSHVDGSKRKVDYTADEGGFKAVVHTNEFGTKSVSSADAVFQSTADEHVAPAPQKSSVFKPAAAPSAPKSGFHRSEQKMVQQEFPRNPYSFNYEAEGSSRQESSDDSGKVMGSYSVMNEDGSTRIVEYIADEMGFRAKVKTNEPGTKSDNPADVSLQSSAEEVRAPAMSSAPGAQEQKPVKHTFPKRTHTQKTSVINQETIY